MEDLAQRPADDASRLERVRDLAQLPIDVDQSQQRVVEAARDQLAVAVEDERIRLIAQERELAGEREDVLHRAVVKVEAEPHQPALAGSHESLLASGTPLEQMLAVEDSCNRSCSGLQIRGAGRSPMARDPGDDGRVGAAESADRHRP